MRYNVGDQIKYLDSVTGVITRYDNKQYYYIHWSDLGELPYTEFVITSWIKTNVMKYFPKKDDDYDQLFV